MKTTPILPMILLVSIGFDLFAQNLTPGISRQDCTVVPFFVFSNLLLVRASVEEREGYFILDTGAPGLILNKRYFQDGKNFFQKEEVAVGVNGKVEKVLKRRTALELGTHEWKNVHACLYDLEYLEEAKGISIIGLLGSLLFRDLELTIDFENQQLLLYPLDRNGEHDSDRFGYRLPDVVIPFRQKGHMPFIEANVEGNLLKLGIDSGAGIGLIIHEKQTALAPFTEPLDSIRIRGLGQHVLKVMTVNLKELTIANLTYSSLKFAFANLSHVNNHFAGIDLDGILGLDLLSQQRTAINFKKKEIYIWIPAGADDQFVLLQPGKKEAGY
jgi:hypothetical protein